MEHQVTLSRILQPYARAAFAFALLAGAASAQAATYNIGVVPQFPATYDMFVSHAPGSFVDYFNFTLVGATRISNSAVGVDLSFTTGASYHLSGLNIDIYDLGNTFYGGALGVGTPQQAALELLLGPGNYYAAVSGVGDGSAGGKYSYTISAIPEAESWVMFAFGIAAVGLAWRRRMG